MSRGGSRQGAGRKKDPNRTRQITLSVSPFTYDYIHEHAKKDELALGKWLDTVIIALACTNALDDPKK